MSKWKSQLIFFKNDFGKWILLRRDKFWDTLYIFSFCENCEFVPFFPNLLSFFVQTQAWFLCWSFHRKLFYVWLREWHIPYCNIIFLIHFHSLPKFSTEFPSHFSCDVLLNARRFAISILPSSTQGSKKKVHSSYLTFSFINSSKWFRLN